MSMPFYVAPEQQMKDRSDYARKGISRGRAVVVLRYRDGICFVAENRSSSLHKISEIYDRIAFAAVGRYNEFEQLRIAGIQQADMRGYAYDRLDVTGRMLANAYAQLLGETFASSVAKPFEVELVVAELGDAPGGDQIYRLLYDGSVADEENFTAMGGATELIADVLRNEVDPQAELPDAIRLAVRALGADTSTSTQSTPRELGPEALEVGVLDRTWRRPRKFRRLSQHELAEVLA